MHPFADAAMSSAFAALPPRLHQPVLGLRELILEVGSQLPELGGMVETLKWGEPAYHPARKRVGTTIRINAHRRSENRYALYVPCQSRLVELYRSRYPDIFTYEGRRALLFDPATPPPDVPLRHCIALALTCHLRGHGAR